MYVKYSFASSLLPQISWPREILIFSNFLIHELSKVGVYFCLKKTNNKQRHPHGNFQFGHGGNQQKKEEES